MQYQRFYRTYQQLCNDGVCHHPFAAADTCCNVHCRCEGRMSENLLCHVLQSAMTGAKSGLLDIPPNTELPAAISAAVLGQVACGLALIRPCHIQVRGFKPGQPCLLTRGVPAFPTPVSLEACCHAAQVPPDTKHRAGVSVNVAMMSSDASYNLPLPNICSFLSCACECSCTSKPI